ncbi:MAG: hypothetical protein K6U08_00185 [Firmicutes bacterium]|nr:hypothetical protein [Bacillota bacterium]
MRWVVFEAVLRKSVLEGFRYLFNLVTGLITLYLFFLMVFLGSRWLVPGLDLGSTTEALVVGFSVWMFTLFAYQDICWGISTEAEVGTLEQLHLSPAGFTWVSTCLALSRFLMNLIPLGLLTVLMMLTTGRWLHLDLVSLIPLLVLTLLPAYGFGYLMGGLALVFKRIQNSFQILQFIFVAFMATPSGTFPWARFLPLNLGTQMLRAVMGEGLALWDLPASDLVTLAVVGVAYLSLGLGAFAYCTRVARDRGLLGHY